MAMKILKVYDRVYALKDSEGEAFNRLNKGITQLEASQSPVEDSVTCIGDKSATNMVLSHDFNWSVEGFRAEGDKANDRFCQQFDQTGDEAETQMLVVNTYKSVEEPAGQYEAKLYDVVLMCENDGSGAGGEKLGISGSIKSTGNDPVVGTAKSTDGVSWTFTADGGA